jgi:hypothetical protein
MESDVRDALIKEQDALRLRLTGDMFVDMELMDRIHVIQMKLEGTKPGGSYIECIGCGS